MLVKLEVLDTIYLKDPESSDLGKRIIEQGILLIDEIGFEAFTFNKLGAKIGSNESSIYRYFENKHKLLLYLNYWYWSWLEYQLVFETNNVSDSLEKLKRALTVVTRKVEEDTNFSHVNEVVLNRIIIHENSKVYLSKKVDKENSDGLFTSHKRVIDRLSTIIQEVNSDYQYPITLASTVIDGALHQHFINNHFKALTNCSETLSTTDFFINLTLKTIQHNA